MKAAQHNYQRPDADGAPLDSERARKVAQLAVMHDAPQMLHAHGCGQECGEACWGMLPPPPRPTRRLAYRGPVLTVYVEVAP